MSAARTRESSMSKAGLDNRHRNKDGERPALEPWIAFVAALGRDPGHAEIRRKHFDDGFNLHHLGAELVALVPVGFDFAG
jgi:hypothetical protein